MPYPAFRRRLKCAVRPKPPTATNFVFARSETSRPRLCAANVPRCPVKQSILWMHLIQTIDFTDQNNFH